MYCTFAFSSTNTRRSKRLFDISELDSCAGLKGGVQSDWPIYAASTFSIALEFLPLLKGFDAHFQRQGDGKWQQVQPIYYVVEVTEDIFTDKYVSIHYLSLISPAL